jgi:hypothetical protein
MRCNVLLAVKIHTLVKLCHNPADHNMNLLCVVGWKQHDMLLRTTLFRVKGGYGIACLYVPIFRHHHHHHHHHQIIRAVDNLLTRSYIRYLIVSSFVNPGLLFQSARHC